MTKNLQIIRMGLAILLSCLMGGPAFSEGTVDSRQFVAEVHNKLPTVLEFKFISERAEKMGVRAWLFGGAASAFAHYVKWDLKRRNGDARFQPDRFDYDYSNIFRSNQDVDIVINGTEEQAAALEKELAQTFPHLQGTKSVWEVRLLDKNMQKKQALLNNPDFLNQNTDSNSTGIIELTKSSDPQIRDLLDWNNENSHFLTDVISDRLHYYNSDKHETTTLFKEGRNPTILSVIRYLTKAFQYELNISQEDYAQIKPIIDRFHPENETNVYVKGWIVMNGKKLMQNAMNVEYAWDTLEKLGLRKKLMTFDDKTKVESLAWWMDKEPLRTKPLGQGAGKTAKELGIDVVAHETSNFLAYENITRAHTGAANVFISRGGGTGMGRSDQGELAVFGDGFYVTIGREGSRNEKTGLTIRFKLDPNARLGEDFHFNMDGPYGRFLIIKNKAALKVIPESLNFGIVEYFDFLKEDNLTKSDLGILEKLKRRINNRSRYVSAEDEARLIEMVKAEISNQKNDKISPILKEWFAFNLSAQHPELLMELMERNHLDAYITNQILFSSAWEKHPDMVLALIKKGTVDPLILDRILALTVSEQMKHPEWIEALIQNQKEDYRIIEKILSQKEWMEHAEWSRWVETMVQRSNMSGAIAFSILSKQHPNIRVEWIESVVRNASPGAYSTVDRALSQPQWQNHPSLKSICGGNEVNVMNLKEALSRGAKMGLPKPVMSVRCEKVYLNSSSAL